VHNPATRLVRGENHGRICSFAAVPYDYPEGMVLTSEAPRVERHQDLRDRAMT
jgi:hypothetical protein